MSTPILHHYAFSTFSEKVRAALGYKGIAWQLGAAQRRYNERLTTQVPWRTTFDTGKRRISRRLQIGKRVVEYENDLTRPAWRRRRSRSTRPV